MGDLTTGLLGYIPIFRIAVLKVGGTVNLVFKICIKVLAFLWNEVFCAIAGRILMQC